MYYMPYHILDETLDKKMRTLTASSTEATQADLRHLRQICSCLGDHDIDRITALTKWNYPLEDYSGWRAGCKTWRDREARFVLAALRWEYYQHYTLSLLWMDSVGMVEMDPQQELENQMMVDEPGSFQMLTHDGDVAARDSTPLLDLTREKGRTGEEEDDGDDDDDDDDAESEIL